MRVVDKKVCSHLINKSNRLSVEEGFDLIKGVTSFNEKAQ